MRLFISSLSETESTPPIEKVPIGLTYVSTRTTTGGATGMTGHIQGFVIDEPNDMVYIAWSNGITKYRFSTLARVDNIVLQDHVGDLAMVGDFIYTCVSNPRTIYEISKSDLTTNRTVDSGSFAYYIGGISYDTNTGKLWGGYGAGSLDDGILQEVNITTLEPVAGSTMTFLNKSDPTDFGDGIQSFSFMPNSPDYIAFCDYNNDSQASLGSNVKFANMNTLDYELIRNFTLPVDYGVSVIGDKAYIIKKNGGSSDTITDVLEFDIIYE